jgi:ATP-dependent Clp protease adaptor protein ClpS
MAAMAKLGKHGNHDAMAEEVAASDALLSPAPVCQEPSRAPGHTIDPLSGSVPSRPHGMAERRKGTPGDGSGTALLTKTRTRTKRPNMYRVLLLNDDYTPMEFVVHVLEQFFSKSREEATRIMLHVHQNGVGECGVFTYEVAETKVTQVMDFARKHQHPLQCVMEKK